MEKSKVILIPCESYQEDLVYEGMKAGIGLLGGWDSLIGKDEKILLKPELVPTNVYGEKMGLGTWREENIRILTPGGEISMAEAVKQYGNPDYRVDRRKQRKNIWNKLDFVMKHFQKKPYVDPERCRKCGVCVEACPVEGKAISFRDGRKKPPVYDYKKCIRCFCCQEMCPYKAIKVK